MIVEEYRQDRGALLSPMWVGTTLFVQGYACKPGILEYRNDDGTITRELCRPEMLQEAAVGLARAPVTLEHPKQDVDNQNWKDVAVGDVDKDVVIEDNGFQRVTLAVRRKDAQDAVTSKQTRELSPGYVAKIDKTPGEHPEYGKYDAEQIGRTYNHLAIVRDARGGSRIALRVDDSGAELVHTIRGDATEAEQHPTGAERMPIDRRILRRLAISGVDVSRVDSTERAVELLMDRWDMEEQMDQELPPGAPQVPGPPVPGQDADYPMNEDGSPMYQDAEGNPLTQDEYVSALEDENEEMRKYLESEAEGQAMDEAEPMAEDLGVEVERGDSALDVYRKIASKALGEPLHKDTPVDYILGVIEKVRRDNGYGVQSDGRRAGRAAWRQARADSASPANVQRRDAAHLSGGVAPGQSGQVVRLQPRSLSRISGGQYNDAFKRRRDAAAGRGD